MVLIVAIGVAAAAYAANNDGGDGEGDGNSTSEPLDLTKKTGIDLLPLERTLALFEAPIATITFMEGDPAVAADFLRSRIADVVYRNPWLGGWLAKDRSHGNAVRLFVDESSDDLCPNLFHTFEAGKIDLTQDTPYGTYGDVFRGHDVVVKINASVIGRTDEPLWRVCVIPDSKRPTERFALVVSMSHMIGDGCTFFKVLNMLRTNGEIETLDPKRKHQFSDEILTKMGKEEAYYINKVAKSPIWAAFQKDDTVIERKGFYIDERWVEGQKRAWTQTANTEATAPQEGDSASDGGPGAKSVDNKRTMFCNKPESYAVSFAARQGPNLGEVPTLSTNDIVTSWFFGLVDAAVGLRPHNFRNRPGMCCTDADAGNYALAVPYTAKDYETPMLIQASIKTGKRAYGDGGENHTALPSPGSNNKYAISVDWRSFQKKGGMLLGANGECKQTLQLPFNFASDVNHIPKTISFVHLYNAGPHGEPAISVIAPQAIMEKIQKSGIVKKMIVESVGESSDADAFAESVQEVATGRRQSVFAPMMNSTLSTILDDEELEE